MISGPRITVYFDVERSYLSVAHLIRRHSLPSGEEIGERSDSERSAEGHIVRVRCRSYRDVLDGLYNLKRGKILSKEEMPMLGAVALDTVSRLADITRKACVNEASMKEEFYDLWARRDSLHAQWGDWGTMTAIVSEVCAKTAAFCEDHGIPFLIASHERITEDKLDNKAEKGGMDLNGKLLSEIEENSDYVWRSFRDDAPQKSNNVQYPAGTYFLQTSTSAKRRTKVRMPPEVAARLGAFRANPNLVEIFDILGVFKPTVLSIFGAPGGGKTTLITSLSDPKNWKEK